MVWGQINFSYGSSSCVPLFVIHGCLHIILQLILNIVSENDFLQLSTIPPGFWTKNS